MAAYTVSAGEPLSGQTISGGTGTILSGGIASDVILTGFGDLAVMPNGLIENSVFTDDEEVTVAAGGSAAGDTVTGGFEVLSGGTATGELVSNGGYQDISSGVAANTSVFGSGAHQNVYGGNAIDTVVSGGGAENVDGTGVATNTHLLNGGSLFVAFGGIVDGTVVQSGGMLQLTGQATANATVLQPGAVLDLASLSHSAGGSAVLESSHILTVTEGGSSASLVLDGSYAGDRFIVSVDSGGGTLVTEESATCFCPGTLIQTVRGEVAVEHLAIGDQVLTTDGTPEAVRWIGRRDYAGVFVAGNSLMLPVCIKTGALRPGVPSRDLHVSPGHGILIDGQLVPAWRMVNGRSIVQAAAVDHVTYLHVELGRHALLLAEGTPAESFLDDGCRRQFHSAAGDTAKGPMPALMARLEDGFALQSLHERLARRAGIPVAIDPAGPLRGFVDQAGPGLVTGWAQDEANLEEPVALELCVGGEPFMCVLANAYRGDLRHAGLGSGCHAFRAALPDGVTGHVLVRRVSDGANLPQTEAAFLKDAA